MDCSILLAASQFSLAISSMASLLALILVLKYFLVSFAGLGSSVGLELVFGPVGCLIRK